MSSNGGEKRIKHYTNSQRILLVGEGDFSFSACLARAFGSAVNMVATSLDSRESLLTMYSKAATHLKELEDLGCTVVHGVNVLTMNRHPLLESKCFDRIVYNFPHARLVLREHDQLQIDLHRNLVSGFLRSAYHLLFSNGQVHITHKTAHPFNNWEIENLERGLFFKHDDEFFLRSDYPGYTNKRGQGARCDKTFPVGECKTFMFCKI